MKVIVEKSILYDQLKPGTFFWAQDKAFYKASQKSVCVSEPQNELFKFSGKEVLQLQFEGVEGKDSVARFGSLRLGQVFLENDIEYIRLSQLEVAFVNSIGEMKTKRFDRMETPIVIPSYVKFK